MRKWYVSLIGLVLLPVLVLTAKDGKLYVLTTSKGVTITADEFKVYYKEYKEKIRSTKSKDWYFNLSDKIAAVKELALQKIILNEALKSNIEQTSFFRKLKPEMKKAFEEIEQKARTEHLKSEIVSLMKAKIKNSYLCKAYLSKEMQPYMQVSDDEVDNFLMAHQGMYALKHDKKNSKAKIIQREALIQLIQNEKRSRIADQIAQSLLKKYDIKINQKLLKQID